MSFHHMFPRLVSTAPQWGSRWGGRRPYPRRGSCTQGGGPQGGGPQGGGPQGG
jgi:hypothetical protein